VRRHVAHGCLIAVSLAAGILVPVTSAVAAPSTARAGGIGVRLVAMRADAGAGPLARAYIVATVAPGKSLRRRVEISNTTRSAAVVAVYPAAASLHRGAFAFAAGRSSNELSGWTSVSQAVLRLPPAKATNEMVTINVPKDASAGERYGVIWAAVSAPAPAGGGVTLVNRVGIRMYLSIGPGGAPPSNFAIGPLAAKRSASGAPIVVATVHNTGERTLDIRGTLTLSDGPGGLRAGPFPVTMGATLGPNASEPATVRLDARLPRGPWHAHLRLTAGRLQRTATATITFPRSTASANPSRSGGGGWLRPVTEIPFVLLVLVGLRLWYTRSRIRRRASNAGSRPQIGSQPTLPLWSRKNSKPE
jgi:hypothetical protein